MGAGNAVTRLNWGKKKRGGVYVPEWKPRPAGLIEEDIAALSAVWDGSLEQRREWARLKDELRTSRAQATGTL